MQSIAGKIATELSVKPDQVEAVIALLAEGATVPFIARYRKEATGGLDDTQLRFLDQRLSYLNELEERRTVILKSITDQEKMTPELEAEIKAAESKNILEDLYLPYKPKRRTKGQIAIEAGLEPLADSLSSDLTQDPETEAEKFIDAEKGIADTKAALDGAKFILMERFAEDAKLLDKVRQYLSKNAHIASQVIAGKEKEGAKYSDYFNHSERLLKTPSHRALAMFRGRNEGVLQITMIADPENEEGNRNSYCETIIANHIGWSNRGRKADKWFESVIQWTWRIKIAMHLENELLATLRESAENDAIAVFAKNLQDLLMAAPAGNKVTIGLDPGLRTGVKVAVIDETGKLLDTTTIYPHEPQNMWDKSVRILTNLCKQFKAELIAIGNGTASRETDKLAGEVVKAVADLNVTKIMVSEAGASVYSASEFAANEFPDLDVSLRGAVSIARRLQDPLAELVKIEPKAIGVGQYQHDVSQSQLAKKLSSVVEDCVNSVGVDVNTASWPLLTQVSGLSKTQAQNIVIHREKQGRFNSREQLKQVERMGPKAFEQSAGFLRISDGDNPLDYSAVHPEAYPVVEKIAAKADLTIRDIIRNGNILRKLKPEDYVDGQFGLPTVTDIIAELGKPGRDPRPEFKTANFKDGVEKATDLQPGMILEGVVTNVANFGAFVDVGVHQDGLVHISALTNKFVADPREVVKAGDIVKVKVLDVDATRNRISFTMRLDDEVKAPQTKPGKAKPKADSKPHQDKKHQQQLRPQKNSFAGDSGNSAMGNAFAEAFAKAKK